MEFQVIEVMNWLAQAGITFDNTEKQKTLGVDLIQEELNELKEAIEKNDKEAILDAIVDLFWVVSNNLVFNGITSEEFKIYAEKVSRSNWSKFCITEQEAVNTIKAYRTGNHFDKPNEIINCHYKKFDNYFVILRDKDNKILKSINYLPVNKL